MVTPVRADSFRTPEARPVMRARKRENALRMSGPFPMGAGARNRTGGLPFTRRREFVPLRNAPIVPVSLSVKGAMFPQVALSRIVDGFNYSSGSGRLRRGPCGLQMDSHPTQN